MMAHDTQSGQFDGVLQEHLELRWAINRIKCALAERHEDEETLRVALNQLDGHLVAHFAHEERGGYFVEIVQMAPRFKSQIDALQRQHLLLLKMMEGLISETNDGTELTTVRWEGIADRFEQFVDRFIEHENDENDLFQRAYCQDIGPED